ncbi:MAG TPA: DUF1569 domain-containing protein [Vicinamibacterales bacterium]|nr:DUF1569 domain-containing protein [Vicinamibacterales bacterium]
MDPFLNKALDDIHRAAGHLEADVMIRAAEGRWSVAEILEHLTLAFTVNRGTFEKVLGSAVLRARRPTLGQRLLRVLVVEVGYFPRVNAPEATRPRGTIAPERSVAAIGEALTALDATLTRVAERFGEDTPVANHPYLAGLSVRQWRKFHWRHTAHHMRQVRARSAAPAGALRSGLSSAG